MPEIYIHITITSPVPGDNRRVLSKMVLAEHVSVVADGFRTFLNAYEPPQRTYDAEPQ